MSKNKHNSKNPCGVCSIGVKYSAICCTGPCKLWHHAACVNISEKGLKRLTKTEIESWSCSKCIIAPKSLNQASLTNQCLLTTDIPSSLQSQVHEPTSSIKDIIEEKIQNIDNIEDIDLETSLNLAVEAGSALVHENTKLKEDFSLFQEKVLRLEGLLLSKEGLIEELETKEERSRNKIKELQRQVEDLQAQVNK